MEDREQEMERGGGGCKKTKITKACVRLSLVFSTPLHKIPPSLFSIPSSLSLSSSLLPVIGQLVGSTEPQTCSRLIQVAQSPLRERGNRGTQHQSLRADEVGNDLQSLCSTLAGLSGRHTLITSDYL